jgi:GNAT superfamily N-acetyltransferase
MDDDGSARVVIDAARYLAALNRCFPNWGDERTFEWAFRGADFIVHDDEAGSAVTYRNVSNGTRAAIMTGSWTLPEARGRGHFSRMIDESLDIARSRDAAMLLAFVTATNPSRRRLESAGATLVPTFYCRGALRHPERSRGTRGSGGGAPLAPARFIYSEDEWHTQFLARPRPTQQRIGETWSAVIEPAEDHVRVHHVAGDFGAAIEELGNVFFFTTFPERAKAFAVTDGFLCVLPIRGDAIVDWDLQNGDRM